MARTATSTRSGPLDGHRPAATAAAPPDPEPAPPALPVAAARRPRRRAAEPGGATEPFPCRNEVLLVGRVSGEPQERSLPSGDLLVTWRVVVDRPPAPRPLPEGVRSPTVDTFDCVARAAGTRRTARGLVAGDVVELSGALRRRFWRAGAGAASRCEVDVAALRRLARSPRLPG